MSDKDYTESRKGMDRLRDSKRRQSIRTGNRCSQCEAWIYPGDGKPRTCAACTSSQPTHPAPSGVVDGSNTCRPVAMTGEVPTYREQMIDAGRGHILREDD